MWSRLAHWILDHPRPILGFVLIGTLFLGYWSLQVRTDHRAGQFVSEESQVAEDFQRASEVFGQSQTILYLVFKDADPYNASFLQALDAFSQEVEGYAGVENTLTLTNVPYLVRDSSAIAPQPLYDPSLPPATIAERLRGQPFLRGLLLSKDGSSAAMMVKIDAAFNDTPERVDLVDRIEARAQEMPGRVAFAGFPYLRTQYAKRVTAEAPLFTGLALLISLFFLYLTFRTVRAVVLPTVIVSLGIVWTIGLIALFDHRLNIVTSMLPALLVIIGMASAIHICTKYFDRYLVVQDQREALLQTIRTVGLSTFLACLTTAIGFGVLILSGSHLLLVFGEFAAAGIMILYGLSITLIPLSFAAFKPPEARGASFATNQRLASFFNGLSRFTRHHSTGIMVGAAVLIAVGIIGLTRISTDIFVFSDFYKDDPLRQDLAVFEEDFGGVLPLEVVIESKKEGRFRSLGNMRRLQTLQTDLSELEPVGRALAATDLVKLANQAYFGGHPATYRLPANHELPFLQSALKSLLDQETGSSLTANLPVVVDSTFSLTQVYLGVLDIGTEQMNQLADTVRARAEAIFPPDQFDVVVTGTAIMTTRSGENLVRNLLVSLGVALLLISVLMALLFRTFRLSLISLLPNVIPLLVVGGTMGFAGIILKPSTALIFSIAFGIAVDNTIHFLAKYRINRDAGWPLEDAVRITLTETGKAILFTSLVLMSGFLVFTLSSFGGTVNMGALTSLTLGVAGLANLVLLPALLYRFGPREHGPTMGVDQRIMVEGTVAGEQVDQVSG